MQKNKIFYVHSILLLIILFAGICSSFSAFADYVPNVVPTTIIQTNEPSKGIVVNHICPNTSGTNMDDGLISRIIPCIKDSIVYTTTQFLKYTSTVVKDAIGPIFAIALGVFGIAIITGNTPSISQSGFVVLLKIAAIMLFINQFNNLYPPLLDALEELLNIMAKPATIAFAEGGAWNHIGSTSTPVVTCKYGTFHATQTNIMDIWNLLDCYLDLIIGGIFSTTTLKMGILGFLVGAVFSTSIGLFVGFFGLYMLVLTLMTIFRAVYIFLTSYVAFSFMVLISMLFIPTILFQTTKSYFDGWLRLCISFLMQPIFVFGYIIMFMVAFNAAIFNGKQSLYYAIAGDDSFSRVNGDPGVENENFHIGDWMSDIGAYKQKLTNKTNARVSGNENTNIDQIDKMPTETKIEGRLMNRSSAAPSPDKLMGDIINELSNISFFEMGIPVTAIDWEMLAQRKNLVQWYAIDAMPEGDDAKKKAKQAAIDKFYLDYKISVLLAFLMAFVVIYIFYSLIEYLPFIGTATLGEGGILAFGEGMLTPPGGNLLGGPR